MPEAGIETATSVGSSLWEGSSEDVRSLDEEDEDDACVCRICRMPGDEEAKLFHPCRCSGSIKYVHESCLLQWLKHSGKTACEVCGHEFSFTPIYADDAPPRLPLMVLIWGAAKKGLAAAAFLQRALMVWVSWLVILPVTTCLMWRIAFAPAKLADSVIRSRISPLALLSDCVQGSLLTALLFILMMMVTCVKDHYDLWKSRLEEHFEQKLRGMMEAFREQDDENNLDSPEHRNPPNLAASSGGEGHGGNNDDWPSRRLADHISWENDGSAGLWPGEIRQAANWFIHSEDSDTEDIDKALDEPQDVGLLRNFALKLHTAGSWTYKNLETWFTALGIALENQLDQLEERLHAQLNRWEEMIQDRLRQWEQNIQDHLDQLEERVEERINQFDQPFERVLGLQGPLHNIFLNMSAVVLFCGLMILACVWLPLRWGWIITSTAKWTGRNLSALVGGSLVPLLAEVPFWRNFALQLQGPTMGNSGSENLSTTQMEPMCPVPTFEALVLENQCFDDSPHQMPKHPLHLYSLRVLSEVEAHLIPPDASELLAISFGWLSICLSSFILMWMRSAWQVWARNGRARVHETGVSFSRWLGETVLGLFVVVKISVLIVLELVVFPAGFGYWLHLCMLPVFKSTTFREVTFVSLLFHWLCGMGFLLGFSSLVRLSRDVLRPGALPFLKDPTRPDRDPFAEMASEPFFRQIAGWLFSCVIYSALGVVLLHIPARLARYICTSLYPVKLLFGEVPVSQLPIDLLLFHMFLPFTIEHFMRSAVRDNLRDWLVVVSSSIGLEEYLLSEEDYQRFAGRGGEPWPRLWPVFTNEDQHPFQQENEDTIRNPLGERGGHGLEIGEENHGGRPGGNLTESEDETMVEWNSGHVAQRDTAELENASGFGIRLSLLAIIWGVSMMACHTAMLVVPVVLGRGLCKGVFGIPSMPYDLFASYVGMLTICAVLEAAKGAVNFGAREDVRIAVQDGMEGVWVTCKVFLFAVCWIGITAFLAGLLVEIIQRPMKVLTSGEDIPVNMLRVWGSGVILLLMWHVRVTRMQRANPQGQVHGHPLNQEIANLHNQGLWQMDLGLCMYQLVLPVVTRLLVSLLLPWGGSKLLRYIFTLSPGVSEALDLYAHLVCCILTVIWKGFAKVRNAIQELETAIRDDHYLVRQELNNFNQVG